MRVLILGGTREGRMLAEALARDGRHTCLLSYAGRTASLQAPALPHRVGGFGGVQGLATFLRDYDALVDATHPFAARISTHAVAAAKQSNVPLLRWTRPAWRPREGDRWTSVATMEDAARALGNAARKVFLTIGRLEVAAFHAAPQHRYLVRAVDAFDPGLPNAELICARGPFTLDDERALLRERAIELLVSKNAGTDATYAKLIAARELAVPVVMVERPVLPAAPETETMDGVRAWLDALHRASGSERGE